jgi:hypothetical protein
VPHTPDFLCSFVGSLNFMRLSLKRGAHAILSRAAYRKFGASRSFSRDVGYHRSSPQASYGLRDPVGVPHVRTSVARISYSAALATTTYAAFSQRKPHEVAQRTSLDRKSGIRGPKTMGEAPPELFYPRLVRATLHDPLTPSAKPQPD